MPAAANRESPSHPLSGVSLWAADRRPRKGHEGPKGLRAQSRSPASSPGAAGQRSGSEGPAPTPLPPRAHFHALVTTAAEGAASGPQP